MTPTALLLHGFTHTGASWDPVVAALGERYRVLAPDIRGHGAAGEVMPSER
jgi:2-succinyl-6-hydroxy-2,4-cyclohexadiene-1-carboxylate synthase